MIYSAAKIDARDRAAILTTLARHVPGYLPEWWERVPAVSTTLAQAVARNLETLVGGLNQVPQRSFLAFLDMIGTSLLPAQSARAPLVFLLVENSPIDVTLPKDSQVAALAVPLTKALTSAGPNLPPVIFATEQAITLSRARLAVLYSIRPDSDEYVDHSAHIADGFTTFDHMDLTEHAIYIGHNELFAFAGDVKVLLFFSLQLKPNRPLYAHWEYLSEVGWLPLASAPQDDTTGGLTKDGQIALRRECGPKAKNESFHGHASYWIRGRLTTRLLPDGTDNQRTVPVVNDIRVRVAITHNELPADAAFADAIALDTSKDFYPFGQHPTLGTTFYLANKEVFKSQGATIKIVMKLSRLGIDQALAVAWEFFDGNGWQPLSPSSSSGNDQYDFTTNSPTPTVTFLCPRDWAESTVNGVKNYWLRVRIRKGDYGKPAELDISLPQNATSVSPNDIKIKPSTLSPPIVSQLTLGYSYVTDPDVPDHCLSYNDFVFNDHTEACRWPDLTFTPFLPVADLQPAVHFGFDQRLPSGLLSLYVDVPSPSIENQSSLSTSPFIWEYRDRQGWSELSVLDDTGGLQRSGLIQFIGQPDAMPVPGLGGDLFRLRARLKQGEQIVAATVNGLWLNAVWATHRITRENEPLGTSDGNPKQTFFFPQSPVLEHEVVEVQEWAGRGDGWQVTLQEVPAEDLRFDRDPAASTITGVWVRWFAKPHLYSSRASDRHYVIERARGLICFGDSRNGMIPQPGSRVVATYGTGGGLEANVPVGAISELHMAVPYVVGVTNPSPATGGAVIESMDSVSERGPKRLRHRDRAVSLADWEWLVREASPDIARVRALPLIGPAGYAQRGWVTIVVVPQSLDPQPQLTPQLQQRIQAYLAERVPATVAQHVRIRGPVYSLISVQAEIVPTEPDEAAAVEARVRERLDQFLHPLSGGPKRRGWVLGGTLYLSQIAQVIENAAGVDYASQIRLSADASVYDERVPIDTDRLPAAGEHELKLTARKD